jgi:hypothetical protein
MNKKKSIIAFVLSSVMVTGALVADAVCHRLANMQAITQSPTAAPSAPSTTPAIPKPNAGTPTDTSAGAATDSNRSQQSSTSAQPQTQKAPRANGGPVQQSQKIVNSVDNSETAPADDASQASPASEPAPAVVAAATTPAVTAAVAVVPRHALTVPAGSVLTIRLGEELASDKSEIGQTFTASLDRDVMVNGKTVIGAGAAVTGQVAFARPIGPITGEPVLQLRLVSVNVDNADVPVVTAIRTFGPKITGKNKVSKFMKGLFKRYEHQEQEVVLDDQSSCSFTLRQPLLVR